MSTATKTKIVPVSFPCQGQQMTGTVHDAEGGSSAALLLPGWAGTRYGPQRILFDCAQALAAAGTTTLRFDFRGRGDSQGDPTQVTLDSMIEDTLAAVEWLRRSRGATKVNLVGLCAGANVALGTTSLIPEDTEAVVAWSILPFMEHKAEAHGTHRKARRALIRHYLKKAMDWDTWKRLLRGEANVRGAVQTLKQDKEGDEEERRRKTSRRDILKDLEKWHGRCLLVFGTKDPESSDSARFFEHWMERRGIPRHTVWIPGAPHNFYTAQWTAEVIRLSVDWLVHHTAPPPKPSPGDKP